MTFRDKLIELNKQHEAEKVAAEERRVAALRLDIPAVIERIEQACQKEARRGVPDTLLRWDDIVGLPTTFNLSGEPDSGERLAALNAIAEALRQKHRDLYIKVETSGRRVSEYVLAISWGRLMPEL